MDRLAYIGFGLLLGYVIFQNQPAIGAVWRKLRSRARPYGKLDDATRRVIAHQSETVLSSNRGNLTKRNISREEALFRSWRAGRWPCNNYGNAWIAMGLMADYQSTGDRDCLAALNHHIDRIIDQQGRFREKLVTVDQCMIGYTLLDLLGTKENGRVLPAIHSLHAFIDEHPRSGEGLIPYRSQTPQVLYIDTLGMICPFLARYGSEFEVAEAAALAARQLIQFHANAREEKSGLLFHAYDERRKVGLGVKGWARGTGWYCMGTSETLRWLPPQSDEAKLLSLQLSDIAAATAEFQRPSGCWGWEMCNPAASEDTSGTAMIAYGIARACATGALPDAHMDVARRALRGIFRHVTVDGKIMQSLADVHGLGDYPQVYGHTPWGQGAVHALCAVMTENERRSRRNG